jgi:hypothetical protein
MGEKLSTTHQKVGTLHVWWGMLAAFGAYFCMYGLRKPFTAATYPDGLIFGSDIKPALVIAQVFGYMLSKFIGVRIITELPKAKRVAVLICLVMLAELALVMLNFLPLTLKPIAMFLNGLPLGMIFGMLLSFLEGRRLTEAMAAALCGSFIVADGAAKSVGTFVLNAGAGLYAMPMVAGGIFLLPFLGFVWMLSKLPPPSQDDIDERAARPQISHIGRVALLRSLGTAYVCIVFSYTMLTILRSFRADFMPELIKGLNISKTATVFTLTETIIAVVVTLVAGLTSGIRINRLAFGTALILGVIGFACVPLAVVLRQFGQINGLFFLVLVGAGIYIPYVLIHTTVFERWIAIVHKPGSSSFLLTLADAIAYLTYVVALFVKPLIQKSANLLGLFETAGLWISFLSMGTMLLALALTSPKFQSQLSQGRTS